MPVHKLNIPVEIKPFDYSSIQMAGYGRNTINGVAFTSSDGGAATGFNYSFGLIRNVEGKMWFDTNMILKHHIESPYFHVVPTDYYKYILPTFGRLHEIGIKFFRVRLSLLKAGAIIPPHRDSTSEADYCVKIHIPIQTNEHCRFVFGEKSYYLEENGFYLADVAQMHSFENRGTEDRYHIIGDCIVTNPDLPLYCRDQEGTVRFYEEWQRRLLKKDNSVRFFAPFQYRVSY